MIGNDVEVVHLETPSEIARMLSSANGSGSLTVGWDSHLGFNFQDLSALGEAMELFGKPIKLQPTVIDESKKTGARPFSPTQVHVQHGSRDVRRTVADSSSSYLSQQPADVERIAGAYQELSPDIYEKVREVLDTIARRDPQTLGDVVAMMYDAFLREQLAGAGNVSIDPMRFDRYIPETGKTEHHPSVHDGHDVLYIALHRFSIGKMSTEGIVEYFRGHFARDDGSSTGPKAIIVPNADVSYLKRD